MKMPRVVKTFCPRCNKHSDHSISSYKKGRDRSLAEGNRRYHRKQMGYGGQTRPKPGKRLSKTTKRQSLNLRCNDCGYIIQKQGKRLRRLEIS